MALTLKQTLALAKKEFFKNPDVVSVGYGNKYRAGANTGILCIVVGVRKKLPAALVEEDRMLPKEFRGVLVDVVEHQEPRAYNVMVAPRALTQKKRPCPPGYSVGHIDITAGTLGWYGKRGDSEEWLVFSNNHVLADSNDGLRNDPVIQPGSADGGQSPRDDYALLDEHVHINFEGGNGKKKPKGASFLWKLWSAPAHFVAMLLGCPYRLRTVRPHVIEQPDPNRVDLAWAWSSYQDNLITDIPNIGALKGVRDVQLGEDVQKTGRTTEYTKGSVTAVNVMVRVSYGDAGVAVYDNQIEIRGNTGEFSAGGDSGSAIVTTDSYLCGILFAGGGGSTFANTVSDIVAFSGMRLQ